MNRIRWYGPSLLLALTVVLVLVLGPTMIERIVYAQERAQIRLVRDGLAANQALIELNQAFRDIAHAVEPSVVNVEVASRNPRLNPMDELRRRFDPRFGPGMPLPPGLTPDAPGQAPGGEFDQFNAPFPYGNGSGWVYDEEGHVITNNHVVAGAEEITLEFADGSKRRATIINTDSETDIAVLKVEGGNLHPAALATDPVEQGDIVFAFGSPFRFKSSMSQGIVSAKGRNLHIVEAGQGYENFIQTDAAINPGNSGGPLTNIRGQVVGMNTAIASQTGMFNGVGFAIPIDMVRQVADQIIKHGKVTRGFLGIAITDLTPRMAATFNFEGQGVLVQQPIEGGPAMEAGIKSGDIITAVGGQRVASADRLRWLVAGYAPGEEVELDIFRDGQNIKVRVPVVEKSEQLAALGAGPGRGGRPGAAPAERQMEVLRKLGLESVSEFTAEMAAQIGIEHRAGVLVLTVRPGSVAAAEGITRGTIVTHVMDEPVQTVDELARQLGQHDLSKPVRLTVFQNGSQRFVAVELPAGQ